jgi:septum site-determining protein MinD
LFDLIDVLSGNCRPRDAILKHSTIDNLWLLPAAQNRSMDELTEKSLDALCNQLAEQFDLVLLDCPPGLEPIPQRVSTVAGRAILVTTTEATAIRDTERLVAEFTANGLTDLYLVINRYCSEYLNKNLIPTETEIADSIGIPLLGTIPEDEAVTIATLRCEPVLIRQPATPAGRIFTALARRLPGKDFL